MAPPTTSTNFFQSYSGRLEQFTTLLSDGLSTGVMRASSAGVEIQAHGLLELAWMPEDLVRRAGSRATLALARDSLLRGAVTRSAPDPSG